uniref:Uncharacterized protein n=1 Tax=Ditylenchus dipsaci TaxID=166011 RepID=A0A915E3K1_9BILA
MTGLVNEQLMRKSRRSPSTRVRCGVVTVYHFTVIKEKKDFEKATTTTGPPGCCCSSSSAASEAPSTSAPDVLTTDRSPSARCENEVKFLREMIKEKEKMISKLMSLLQQESLEGQSTQNWLDSAGVVFKALYKFSTCLLVPLVIYAIKLLLETLKTAKKAEEKATPSEKIVDFALKTLGSITKGLKKKRAHLGSSSAEKAGTSLNLISQSETDLKFRLSRVNGPDASFMVQIHSKWS